jgi:hypothetical protein
MSSNRFRGTIGGAILGFSLLLGIGFLSSTTVQAQYNRDDDYYGRDRDRDWRRNRNRDRRRDRDRRRNDDRYGRNGQYGNDGQYGNYGRNGQYGNNGGYDYRNIYRVAINNGYQAGLNTGSSDGQRGQSYNPQRSRYYRNADYGYNSSYGHKDNYRQAFREGFVRGYQEGYQRYGGYNRDRNRGRGNYGTRFPF